MRQVICQPACVYVALVSYRSLQLVDPRAQTMSTLVEYFDWESPVANEAAKSIATTGIDEAFHGVGSFYAVRCKLLRKE